MNMWGENKFKPSVIKTVAFDGEFATGSNSFLGALPNRRTGEW